MNCWLRAESLLSLSVLLIAYAKMSGDWRVFCWFFLLPDVSLLAFFFGARIGSIAYNVAHSLLGPLVLSAFGIAAGDQASLVSFSLIWLCHIHLDRSLGYGLKRVGSFRDTHLGAIGRSHSISSDSTTPFA